MNRTRMNRTMRIGLMAVGGMAAIAGTAYAVVTFDWDHPCTAETLECIGEPPIQICWCEAGWSVAGNWTGGLGPYPDGTSDNAFIDHSNTGTCDGGVDDGEPCSVDGDCQGRDNTCEKIETYLDMELTESLSIHKLYLTTISTTAQTDHLVIRLNGAYTLTPTEVNLDASNGELSLSAAYGAGLQTN